MRWTVELYPEAIKRYDRLARNLRERIRKSLGELQGMEHPASHRQVIPLVGQLKGFYRLRVGDYRIIFELLDPRHGIAVHAIVPRGGAYR